MEIKNKNIILTGASSGIGKELLSQLIRYDNMKIIAVARHIENIPDIKGVVFPFSSDISTSDGVDKVFAYAQQVYGDTDIFIANAGFAYLEKLHAPDWKHIEDIFSLNVFSQVYALEKLMQQGDNHKTFVSVVSGVALVSLPGYSLYCSTKAAIHQFAETFRYEKSKNLHLMSVYPVATRTSFFNKATNKENTPLPFPQQNTDIVARKIIQGIEKDKKKVYPSLLFRISYPLMRTFPFLGKIYSMIEKHKVKNWI